MPSIPLRVTIAPSALEDVDFAVDGAVRDAFDLAEVVMREEGNRASVEIVTEGFALATGLDGALPLKIRSGRALRTITAETKRLAPFHILTRVGALNPPEDVRSYLTVQEYGATLMPRTAEKLAYPPGDAGEPARNEQGIQVLTARQFLEDHEALGYSFVLFTESAILARQEGMREFDLIFVRAESVTIPARQPIGREELPMHQRIERGLKKALG